MILADYTINFAVDYVMYPAVVGAIGLAIGLAVKLLRRVDLSCAKRVAWAPMLVLSLGGLGFSIGSMPKDNNDQTTIIRSTDILGSDADSNAKRIELAKIHYEYKLAAAKPAQEQASQELIPAWARGALVGFSVALILCSIASFAVWLHHYVKENQR